jgi:hypothetical protein
MAVAELIEFVPHFRGWSKFSELDDRIAKLVGIHALRGGGVPRSVNFRRERQRKGGEGGAGKGRIALADLRQIAFDSLSYAHHHSLERIFLLRAWRLLRSPSPHL